MELIRYSFRKENITFQRAITSKICRFDVHITSESLVGKTSLHQVHGSLSQTIRLRGWNSCMTVPHLEGGEIERQDGYSVHRTRIREYRNENADRDSVGLERSGNEERGCEPKDGLGRTERAIGGNVLSLVAFWTLPWARIGLLTLMVARWGAD